MISALGIFHEKLASGHDIEVSYTWVAVDLLRVSDLDGDRNGRVFIRNSMHVPLKKEAVRDAMPAFFDPLRVEKHPDLRVTFGHFIFI